VPTRGTFGGIALVAILASAGCGSPDEESLDATTTGVSSTTTLEVSTTSQPPNTTTTFPPTTTALPTPADLRQELLAELDSKGWITYTDASIGWSIRHPADWTVVADEPGDLLVLEWPNGQGYLLVLVGQDAVPGETSLDYVVGNVEFAVDNGILETLPEETFWLDHDFDGVDGPLDIYGGESTWADDLVMEATPVRIEAQSPAWWYGYYNTNLQPDYGYMMQTVGEVLTVGQTLDDVVLSFEPPANQ